MIRSLLALLALGAGLRAAPFDKGGLLGLGAREAGQGGAVVARVDNSSALWWNPAGLDARRDFDLGLHYGDLLGSAAFDSAFDHRGWFAPLELGYGLGYRHLGFRAAADEEELGFGVAFPFSRDQRLNMGFALRSLQSRLGIPGVEARGYGLDLGLSYRPPLPGEALRFGLVLRDFQSELNWSTGVAANPAQLLQAGVAWDLDPDASLELDTEMVSDPASGSPSSQGFKLGAERWWDLKRYGLARVAALRLGYFQSSALAPKAMGGLVSAGLGLQYQGLSLDYAFVQDVSSLGPTHRMSAAYRFGQAPGPRPTATATLKATPPPAATPTSTPTPTALAVPAGALGLQPEADIFAPIGQSERRSASLAVGYQGNDVQRWTLSIFREGSPKALRILSGSKLPAKLSWDGFNSRRERVPDGGYRLLLAVERSGGGSLKAETRLDVDTRRPNLDLGAEPKVFEPKGGANAVTFVLGQSAEAGIPARWSLSVETLTGKKLRSFGGKGSPPPQVLWDGTDEAGKGVPGGALYYADFVVAMESGALARLPRVALASALQEPSQPFKVTLQTLHFDEGEESIPLEEFPGLKEAAAAVKKSATDYVVVVGGYAAEGESGKAGLGELELSFLRAKSVRDFLVESEGLPADKVRALGRGSKGQSAGALPGPAARAAARSAEVIIYAQ